MSTIGILTNILPTLPNCPGSPRLFNFIKEWSKNNKIVLICISSEVDLPVEISELLSTVIFLPEPSEPLFFGRLFHRILNLPYFLESRRNAIYLQETREIISSLTSKHDINHLHVNQLNNAQYVPDCLNVKNISIDVRDALPAMYIREATLEKNLIKKFDLYLEAYGLGKYLQKIGEKGYFISMVSQDDSNYLRDKWNLKTSVIPNGVDINLFERSKNFKPRKAVAIFTGIMNYLPNVDTAKYFVENIFPIVRKLNSKIEFHIVGANPTQDVLALGDVSGVKVVGFVPSMQPFLESASVFVCPMRMGAGIKNKILSAMAAELPIVATTMGIAGVEIEDGIHCFVRNDDNDFAKMVVGIIDGSVDVDSITTNAKNKILEKYSWKHLAELYLEKMKSLES